jgi:hypothetical protein
MDVELQLRTPEHGLGRNHPETAAGHGRMMSTSQPHQKWGDYPTPPPMRSSVACLQHGRARARQGEQLLGVVLAGERPETGAGAAGEDDRIQHHNGLFNMTEVLRPHEFIARKVNSF